MRLAATLRAGLAEGIFNGLPEHELPRQRLHGAQCGGDHRFAPSGEQAGRLIGVWRGLLRQRDDWV